MQQNLLSDLIFWGAISTIIFSFISFSYRIHLCKKNKTFLDHKKTIDGYPGVLSTLGVLGTFIGIAVGLMHFNPSNIDASVPILLEGLKTAFLTSILGMIGSIILSHFIRNLSDKVVAGQPKSEDEATARICKAVESLEQVISSQNNAQSAFYQQQQSQLQSLVQIAQTNSSAVSTMTSNSQLLINKIATWDSLLTDIVSCSNQQLKQSTSVGDLLEQLNNTVEEQVESSVVRNSENVLLQKDQIKLLAQQIDEAREQRDLVEQQINIGQESLDETKKYSEVLRGEVIEITSHMDKTNTLLNEKFEEFSELLKKSNTEALVEVMKKVTEEFQKQMNQLISKLIQENFEELNKSVQQMNTWQQENKEMVSDLTSKYKAMNESFGQTSDVLKDVSGTTKELSGNGGELSKLVHELQKVMIDDTKFQETTKMLTDAAEVTRNSMTLFDESTHSLNDWVRKQKNFVDGVLVLVQKLDEIGKIKDYGEEFWRGTRESMETNVGVIQRGSESLNSQIQDINLEFYTRLNTTLSALDNCILSFLNNDRR